MGTRSKGKRKARPTTDQQPTPPPSRRRKAERTEGWAALASQILREILSRLPQADVLHGAGLACASWRRVAAHDPLLWRRINLADDGIPDAPSGRRAMARVAVDRSAGRYESFRSPVDGEFLHYLADK
ncbi:hypothetical protein BRADI_3g17370v3 [Brachypodium distachyon]|uniref:F-box domain-containing protein n=1 Tax=Brachypodium distachyon TaxID=15368 RepID=I1I1Q8_BRADI|nr:hypothetical protein BRADI_3g17370v3 [Brachypodium distachyon]